MDDDGSTIDTIRYELIDSQGLTKGTGIVNAGLYQIKPKAELISTDLQPGESENYVVNPVNGTLRVNKANSTISLTRGEFEYDGTAKAATGFAYGVGGVADVLTPAVTFVYTGTGETTYGPTPSAPVNAGTYRATATFVGNGNYLDTDTTATLVINTKAASVSPLAANKTYGSADPDFTGTLTGFIEADGVTAVYSRNAGETVTGSPYTISAALSPAEVLSNYSITYDTAHFTIHVKDASVKPIAAVKTDGDSDPALGGTLSGFLEADGITATYSRTEGETVLGSPYIISAVLSPAEILSNYNIHGVDAAHG